MNIQKESTLLNEVLDKLRHGPQKKPKPKELSTEDLKRDLEDLLLSIKKQ